MEVSEEEDVLLAEQMLIDREEDVFLQELTPEEKISHFFSNYTLSVDDTIFTDEELPANNLFFALSGYIKFSQDSKKGIKDLKDSCLRNQA